MARLLWLALLVCLWSAPPVARADYSAVPNPFRCNGGPAYASQADACNHPCSSCTTPPPYQSGITTSVPKDSTFPGPYTCLATYYNNSTAVLSCTVTWTCPYGGTLSGTNCIGGNPPPLNPCQNNDTANTYVMRFDYDKATLSGAISSPPKDDGVCIVIPVRVLKCYKSATTGLTFCFWEVYKTKTQAVPGTENPVPPGPTQDGQPKGDNDQPANLPTTKSDPNNPNMAGGCPQGSVQYGSDSDGIPLCIGTGAQPTNPPDPPKTTTGPTTTTTNPDGSTTQSTTTTQTNADGSTTTTVTQVITMPDGSKTTSQQSTTGNTPLGAPGQMSSPSTDASDLCKQHPELAICHNSAVSGSCDQIVCEGDAVQCATLRAAALIQCAQKADTDAVKAMPVKATGDAILSAADPQKADIDTLMKGSTVDMSAPNLDQTAFLGGSQCLANRSFSVMGQTVTMDFTTVCDNIAPLRGVVMACAFLVAYLIVARSVLNS